MPQGLRIHKGRDCSCSFAPAGEFKGMIGVFDPDLIINSVACISFDQLINLGSIA